MARTSEGTGETFGIGFLHPGWAEGAVPRLFSRPTPVVAIGDRIAGKLPVKAIRLVAAAVFAVLEVLTIAGIGG